MMTLYAPMASEVAERMLKPAVELLEQFGFRWWLSPDDLPDLTVVIETPQVWLERGPTGAELDEFFRLYHAGEIEEARAFAQTGWPDYRR